MSWKLEGYDTFAEEYYPLEGEYSSEKEAQRAAAKRLQELERTQPSRRPGGLGGSGGQGSFGIQDRVFVIRPDGSRYRYIKV